MALNFRMCKVRFGRMVALLLITVILLLIVHMSLLSQLEAKEKRKTQKTVTPDTFLKFYRDLIGRLENAHKVDHSGSYHLLENVIVSEWNQKSKTLMAQVKNDVTLVTQCSPNHLHHVKLLSHRWNGPVSLTVFTYSADIVHTLKALAHVYLCNSHVKKWVSLHLVFPILQSPDLSTIPPLDHLQQSCVDFHFQVGSHENYANTAVPYPHNLLRNVAIKYSITPFIFLLDIDMVPSPQLRTDFRSFMAKRLLKDNGTEGKTTAYVVPAFEIKEGASLPSSKTELLAAWKNDGMRPFYADVCWKCQKHVDYDRWKALGHGVPEKVEDFHVAYTLSWKDPWEPFYIAPRSLPLYDERFKQYGFNRISQVCEMHIAGFQFSVLSSAFLVHQGFKTPERFHASKEEELNRNRQLFRHFKEELKTKYPNSARRCY